ncbi:hypothetical protein D8674_024020 [Pyrus ussuriensis x Pyrus communis]|uniref:Uncharacterized protein n=1 Tax=Pyrus ussuriensis x Pyrus communis TaxID=2448454 RepID=A0A5N5H2N4_9ROSA|nr:uncharacterized protein LOC103962178 [Pyrus x bretschneideri]KAB2621838.1 hypothetical protein D8674_024020 [Pyrus ussuriensis x Pyrus communis]
MKSPLKEERREIVSSEWRSQFNSNFSLSLPLSSRPPLLEWRHHHHVADADLVPNKEPRDRCLVGQHSGYRRHCCLRPAPAQIPDRRKAWVHSTDLNSISPSLVDLSGIISLKKRNYFPGSTMAVFAFGSCRACSTWTA